MCVCVCVYSVYQVNPSFTVRNMPVSSPEAAPPDTEQNVVRFLRVCHLFACPMTSVNQREALVTRPPVATPVALSVDI